MITLLGDLKNGRTVHSLVTLLCHYAVRLNFVAPPSLSMPASVVSAACKAGISVRQLESLEEVLPETDVLYVTRIQKERFANESEWQKVKDLYRVDHALLSRAKEDMIVMHPLPRVNGEHRAGVVDVVTVLTMCLEIDPEVDFDSRRAVYFRQMRYGLFVCICMVLARSLTKALHRFRWRCLPVFWEPCRHESWTWHWLVVQFSRDDEQATCMHRFTPIYIGYAKKVPTD